MAIQSSDGFVDLLHTDVPQPRGSNAEHTAPHGNPIKEPRPMTSQRDPKKCFFLLLNVRLGG